MAEEAFINVWFDKDEQGATAGLSDDFYGKWTKQSSAKHSSPALFGADALRRLYPKHSVVATSDYSLNILSFPGAQAIPVETTPLITNILFIPLARNLGSLPGVLVDQVQYGTFNLIWDKYEFLLFTVQYPSGFGTVTQYYILNEGPEDPIRTLLMGVGAWSHELHDEIWVYNQSFWRKDHGLWQEVQKADWKDVILKEEFKKTLQKDVYGFFSSESIYKELAIPWKRGLIMYGPPGNGKTISLKAIMKYCGAEGFAPLYVKSFKRMSIPLPYYAGEEAAIADVFNKARQLAPCIIILEDLDSLINDGNRSFFLNQVDGLEGNDGLLIIGTTNHFDRLDPGLSTRPSRFDRKYKFDDPDREERALYAKYWQNKLKDNKKISFPDHLVNEIAEATERFSFAYLKEAFVSSLVILAGYEGDDKPTFATMLKEQIKMLRKQLDKSNGTYEFKWRNDTNTPIVPRRPARPNNERDVHTLLDALSDSARPSRIFDTGHYSQVVVDRSDRDVRILLDEMSDSLGRSEISSRRSLHQTLLPDARSYRGGFRTSEDLNLPQRQPDSASSHGGFYAGEPMISSSTYTQNDYPSLA
ncbi:P-loop containing nucleoside triphosphate hydrolase protein [Collybia nuda]|uniref:P-loop containing nucleoside triphosphate hydrolase protein n=1 Tax=Collybia nuda TaxID=64659 RepID=A0A9P5YAZ1_9AGAR|nr:P-loop containing nucleoside triphosphate hydrolase protein [Collybia nuda]